MSEGNARPMSDRLCEWLETRGLDCELAARLGLWSATGGADGFQPNLLGDWVAIPYAVDGEVVTHKYRCLSEKRFATDKGFGGIVWNHDALTDDTLTGPLIVTEGEWDAMAAIQAGHPRVVSVPNGAPKRLDGAMAWLDAVVAALRPKDEVIIAADGDAAGGEMVRVLTARLGPGRCKLLRYPKGCKDLGDALRLFGVKGVRATLERAAPVPVKGLFANADVPLGADLVAWRPAVCPKLDEMVAICPGQWSVWTGMPGEGKTTLTQAVFFDILDRYDIRAAWYSGEKDPNDLKADAAAWLAKKPKKLLTAHDHAAAARWLDEHVWHIIDETDDDPTGVQSLGWFLEIAETAAFRHGCRLFVLDPWNDLDHEMELRETETQYIGRSLKAVKRFCRRHDAHVAIVAHPTKLKRGEKADGYSISGSANWNNKTFLGATVSRVKPDEGKADRRQWPTKLEVWKIKDHEQMGVPGSIELRMTAGGRFEANTTDEDFADMRKSKPAPEYEVTP